MTKEQIRRADEQTLQARWNELIDDVKTYAPGQSEQNKEYLLIGISLALLRKQTDDAICYSEELWDRYHETLMEVEE